MGEFKQFIRIFFFTSWADTSIEALVNIIRPLQTKYFIVCKETGEKKGGVHYHGYVELKKKRRFTALGKLFGCHIMNIEKHPLTGDPMYWETDDYCKKQGDFIAEGTPPVQVDRIATDKEHKWRECIRLAERGKLHLLKKKYPSMFVCHLTKWTYLSGLKYTNKTFLNRKCLWIFGESGIGKTRWVSEYFPHAYRKNPNDLNFQRYTTQKALVIEDLGPEHKKVWSHMVLQMCDLNSFVVNQKYGSVHLIHTTFVVTSNYRLEEVFPWEQTHTNPWQRRFIEFEAISYQNGDLQVKNSEYEPSQVSPWSPPRKTFSLGHMLREYNII